MLLFIIIALLLLSLEINISFGKHAYYKPRYNINTFIKDKYTIIMLAVIFIIELSSYFNSNLLQYKQIFSLLMIISFVPMLYKYEPYKYKGFKISFILFILGSMLNYIAIKTNDDLMPVFADLSIFTGLFNTNTINDGTHSIGGSFTQMIPLTDIIDLGFNVYSIGDILMLLLFTSIIYFSAIDNHKINL